MAKRIDMTRERKIALPVILAAARAHLTTSGDFMDTKERNALEQALEVFNG
jgi:hypothetical protein